ncbi:type I glutamate--ammonia ligase [Actinomyces minihominis]|uniref:type I glutamate--ammonia ligase n=1 Tax=Actinomyces minihominis TaxID=2002838 RepID=UPI000C06B108|nr:type I glutamate--ammonia ligase [Actinomyces minihominis]
MVHGSEELLAKISEQEVQNVDVRFCDLPGVMQHFTIPASSFGPEVFTEGVNFDGSSITGFQKIHESDMTLIPDPATAYVDPFRQAKALNVACFVFDPATGEHYSRDPRVVAFRAEQYLRDSGIADTAYFAPEAEFYIFDDVRYESKPNSAFFHLDSAGAEWNKGRKEEGGNLGYKTRHKGGYFPVAPTDHYDDLRDEIVLRMEEVGLRVERAHHEVGSAGQSEINWRFNSLLKAADDLMTFKYLVKNTAWKAGKSATFMPKPLYGENGSGMHVHQSLWKDGKPLFFAEDGYANLSDTARWYIGGILKHAPSLLAFTNPTVNSYHRLVPGFEAPTSLVYSEGNRSAAIRIPVTGMNPNLKRIEFRCPDGSGNPYLAFSAMLLAGIDGVQNQIEPPEPMDRDLYHLSHKWQSRVAQVPTRLGTALDALEEDYEYLVDGGVFTPDLLSMWVGLKRDEIRAISSRPHPMEFDLYYGI